MAQTLQEFIAETPIPRVVHLTPKGRPFGMVEDVFLVEVVGLETGKRAQSVFSVTELAQFIASATDPRG